jgi:hypothetical protein
MGTTFADMVEKDMEDWEMFKPDLSSGSGESVMVSFKMKKEDADDLQKLVDAYPGRIGRSEMLRDLVMPYIVGLRYAQEGRHWKGALELGQGFISLNKALKVAAEKEETMNFNQGSVMDLPGQI